VLGLLACACAPSRRPAALGWSLGGEAHVFVAGNRFARDLYRQLTNGGGGDLSDSLSRKSLLAIDPKNRHTATVLSASGAAPARLVLARFHARESCGSSEAVTELVFAFPPGGAAGHSTPPSHVPVVALLDLPPFAGGAGTPSAALGRAAASQLVRRVAERADTVTGHPGVLLHTLALDADQSSDAGEVVSLFHSGSARYAVGVRGRFLRDVDTLLITGVAVTDTAVHDLRWAVRPQRVRLAGGTIPAAARRYSLRGAVAGAGGGTLLLIDEIADVSVKDSRALAVDADTRSVVAEQPLALRCP
jgi:hypothetical protein